MMKFIPVVLLLMLSTFFAEAQVIPKDLEGEYIVFADGRRADVNIIKDKGKKLLCNQRGSSNKTQFWVKKKELKDYHAIDWMGLGWSRNDAGQIEYQAVVQVDSVSKNDLYTAARTAFADLYKDSEEVLEVDDREGGIMVARGWTRIYTESGAADQMGSQLWFSTKLEFKDGRYRMTIYDLKTVVEANPITSRFEKPTEEYSTWIAEIHQPSYKKAVLQALQGNFDYVKSKMLAAKGSDDNW